MRRMLDKPLPSLDAYVDFLTGANLPVLRHTKRQLEEAAGNIERISARELSQIVLHDPLMAMKVLAYIQPYRGKSAASFWAQASFTLPPFLRWDSARLISDAGPLEIHINP